MRPYIAILIDSFWEAVSNKVLWALLIAWSFVLLGLAPFGYISERSFRLSTADIDNRDQLINKLATGLGGQGPKAIQAVAAQLEPTFANKIKSQHGEQGRSRSRVKASDLATALNAVLSMPALYSEQAFPTASRRKRLEPLTAMPAAELPAADLEELNRELLQIAFPLELNQSLGEQLWIGYAGFKLGEPLPVSRRQIKQFLEPILLGTIIKLGLGVLAVFIGIIVTSPMVPDTFRSGSLHLLLSKPISRVWLYLSKFLGGCIFVLVNITFVLIGLYFIAGVRFDIWNNGLLACIPLLLFVFMIFYSVSALVGLIWGNAIVSVIACLIFWLFCFLIGFMHDAMRPHIEVYQQVRRIREIDERVMAVNERGHIGVWNERFSVWQPAIETESSRQSRAFGPIYSRQHNLILVKLFFRQPFGELTAPSRKLDVIHLSDDQDDDPTDDPVDEQDDEQDVGPSPPAEEASPDSDAAEPAPNLIAGPSTTPQTVAEARETPVWVSDPGAPLPPQLWELVEMGDDVIAVCRGGLYRLDFNKMEQLGNMVQTEFFGLNLSWLMNNVFEDIAPSNYFLSDNSSASATADGEGLIVYSTGTVEHLVFDGQRLSVVNTVTLDGDGTEAALVAMNSKYCVIARDGRPVEILDNQLRPIKQLILPNQGAVRQLAWIPESEELAVITHTGELLRVDCGSGVARALNLPAAGKFTTMQWISKERLWLGVQPNWVQLVELDNPVPLKQLKPASTTFERIYNWLVKPIYLINPKPAAMDNAMGYLLTGNQTQSLNIITYDLQAAQLELEFWVPIVSNLLFVATMLGIGSFYIAKKEF